jgi:hypothetical protein
MYNRSSFYVLGEALALFNAIRLKMLGQFLGNEENSEKCDTKFVTLIARATVLSHILPTYYGGNILDEHVFASAHQ